MVYFIVMKKNGKLIIILKKVKTPVCGNDLLMCEGKTDNN